MLLEHYIESPRLLRYDPHTGLSQEQPRAELAETNPTSAGFFADSTCGLWGVYASPRGPVLFHGTRRFELAEPSTSIDLVPGQVENRFSLRQGGVIQAECSYKRAPRTDWGFDSWSAEEESADFFLWLKSQFGTADFIERFTTSNDVSGDA